MRGRSSLLPLALAIGAGVAFGVAAPTAAAEAHFLVEAFIRLLGWLMCPQIFCMLVDGAAALGRNRRLGRIGAAMLLYFCAISVLSMAAGLLAGWVLEPGTSLAPAAHGGAVLANGGGPGSAPLPAWLDYLPALHFNNLGILAMALPAGLAAGLWPQECLLGWLARARKALLGMVKILLWLSPVAAFGAMASAVSRSGLASLLPLLKFIVAINLASVLFVCVVYGAAAHVARMPLLRFVVYLRDELFLVAFTGATLAALAPMSDKLHGSAVRAT